MASFAWIYHSVAVEHARGFLQIIEHRKFFGLVSRQFSLGRHIPEIIRIARKIVIRTLSRVSFYLFFG